MYKILTCISFAFRDIVKHKLILALIVISLSIAFSAVFLTDSFLRGFQKMMHDGAIGYLGHIVLTPTPDNDSIPDIERVMHELNAMDEIEAFAVRSHAHVRVSYQDNHVTPYLSIGVHDAAESRASLLPERMIEGDFIDSSARGNVVLGLNLANSLVGSPYDTDRVGVGDQIEITTLGGRSLVYTISGIMDAKTFIPNWFVVLPKDELEEFEQSLANREVVIKLKDDGKIEEVRNILENKNLEITVASWQDEAGYVDDIMEVMSFIMGLINSLLLLSVFVIMSIVIFINVLQKRRQIGIIKSMGASNLFIISVYVMEAFLYAVISYAIGFGIFWSVHLYSSANPMPLLIGDFQTVFEASSLKWSLLISMLAALSGSLIPSYLAAKTRIAKVIKDNV